MLFFLRRAPFGVARVAYPVSHTRLVWPWPRARVPPDNTMDHEFVKKTSCQSFGVDWMVGLEVRCPLRHFCAVGDARFRTALPMGGVSDTPQRSFCVLHAYLRMVAMKPNASHPLRDK